MRFHAVALALTLAAYAIQATADSSATDAVRSCDSSIAIPSARRILGSDIQDPSKVLLASDALFRAGHKAEATFWAYAGLLRLRDALIAQPVEGGLFTIFQRAMLPITNHALHEPDRFAQTLDDVLKWDRAAPNSFRSGPLDDEQKRQFASNRESLARLAERLRREGPAMAEEARNDAEIATSFALGCRG